MSVNSYLKDLASDLVLSTDEKESISTSIDTIKNRLGLYFTTDVEEKKVFGSYDRGTILPRKDDENSDVDLMVVFKNPYEYKPQTFLKKLKNFAEKYYSRSEIYQSSPTVVLELHHIKFELVPAYKKYGCYYIPNGQSDWTDTDPDGFKDTLIKCNNMNSSKIKPMIRLLKHWNIKNNDRDLASFSLEKQIAENMMFSFLSCSSYTDYLKNAFEKIKYSTSIERVNKAIEHIDDALEYEKNGREYLALLEIKRAFPEV